MQYNFNHGKYISLLFSSKPQDNLLQGSGLDFSETRMERLWISWSCQESHQNHCHSRHGQSPGYCTPASFAAKVKSPPNYNGGLTDKLQQHDHGINTVHRKHLKVDRNNGVKIFHGSQNIIWTPKHTGWSSSCFYINIGPRLFIIIQDHPNKVDFWWLTKLPNFLIH
jgi:hypothetical protein